MRENNEICCQNIMENLKNQITHLPCVTVSFKMILLLVVSVVVIAVAIVVAVFIAVIVIVIIANQRVVLFLLQNHSFFSISILNLHKTILWNE